MSIPSWFWPASGATARSVAVAAYGAGMAVADWLTPTLWPFSSTSFGVPVVLGSGTPGISDLATDASSGVWAIGWGGTLWHQPAAGSATSGQMPSGQRTDLYGCTIVGTSAYVMSSSGVVYTTGGTAVGHWPVTGGRIRILRHDLGSAASGLRPGNDDFGRRHRLIAFPSGIVNPTALFMASGLPTAMGGWQNARALSGAAAAALSPVNPNVMVESAQAEQWYGARPARYPMSGHRPAY